VLRPIKTNADYQDALACAAALMDADDETPEADELDILATLIEAYEDKNFPMDLPSPAAAITFRMEQQGMVVSDLVPLIGNAGQVNEVLSGKLDLTLQMIRALHEALGIPADVLIQRARGSRATEPANAE
jgi:HTH-type transcriptional regulator / antitoxin HigA